MELTYQDTKEKEAIKDQEGLENWVRGQFQRANAHIAKNGILFDSIFTDDCRYLAPFLAIWKIKDREGKLYWVVSGDLPVDFVSAKVAKDAREAIRHFSMAWQLKAEAIIREESSDEVQKEFSDLLIKKAEQLYEAQANDKWWQV